jgi:DNA polymerase III subunit delta'
LATLWDTVVGHTAAKLSLQRAVEQNRTNHAYIFTGPRAVGKFMVARAFAAALLCPQGGCGTCNICRRVLEGKHPDVTVIKPAGKNIPVDAIRAVRMDAFRRPAEADRKVYIIKNAERMWEEGASTLLKVLEEPPGDVVFVLVTDNAGAVLPTIRSRCQEIRFANIPIEDLKEYLVETRGVTEARADLIARLTGGVLGRALDWCDEPWRLTRRDNVVKTARALRRADLNRVLEMAGELHREVRAPVEELAADYQEKKQLLDDGSLDNAVVRRFGKEFDEELKREQLKEELRGVKEVLSTLSWWYRDILIYKEGGDAGLLVNRDLEPEIAEEASALPLNKLLRCIELIEESIRAAEQNVTPQLNIESTLLGLQEALYA